MTTTTDTFTANSAAPCTSTTPIAMDDRKILARVKLAEAVRLEVSAAPHPHTRTVMLDVLQFAATSGWSEAIRYLRMCTSSHLVITAQTAARLLAQYDGQRSDTA